MRRDDAASTHTSGGGLASAGLLVAVLPANVQMTVDSARDDRKPWWFTLGTILRLPLQVPMIRIALRAATS